MIALFRDCTPGRTLEPSGTPHTGGTPHTSHKLTVNGFIHKNTRLETGQRRWLGSVLTDCHMKEGDLPQSFILLLFFKLSFNPDLLSIDSSTFG